MIMRNDIEFENKNRCRCPFYGFYLAIESGLLLDEKGDRCALVTDSYSPCKMQINNETPDWAGCGFNHVENKGILEKIINFRVFPDEFEEGMSFKEWVEYLAENSE